jgi:hypothetical protein
MGKFDFSNWKDNKLAYVVIVVIVVIVFIYVRARQAREYSGKGIDGRKIADGNGTAYYYGRGSDKDSVGELLDRIDWASYLDKRLTLWYRIFVTTVITLILIVALVMRRIPKPGQLILLGFVIFIPFYAGHQLFYVHGDIFNDYYIKNNVDLIRKKLGVHRNDVKEPCKEVPRRTDAMNPK